jgi:hypothetical protein
MTYRLVADLIEQLPPTSRTKTAMRDDIDPHTLAAMSGPRKGWGPHSHTDDILCRIGEAVDRVGYYVIKVQGGKAAEPMPWRRPGVLGPDEIAELLLEVSGPVIDQLDAERAERERRRREQAKG